MPRLLITGGHLTPALAFIDWLRHEHPDWSVVFVGREYAQVQTKQPSWEREEISKRSLQFIPFEGQKTGHFNPFTFTQTVGQAARILREQKVNVVLSFGGYLAVPFAIAARYYHLGVVTHEQTRVLGRSNRLLSFLAGKTAISYPDTQVPFYVGVTTLTGNPLRSQLFVANSPQPTWFTPTLARPVLYISGGSQGAKALNELILPILAHLTQYFLVIHQVGRRSSLRDPLGEINQYIEQHYPNLTNYFPREFLSVVELAYFYPRINIALGRSGANTVAELTAFKIPALYIPLPQANYDEQYLNAAALAQKGGAIVARQEELTPSRVLELVRQLEKQQESMSQVLGQQPTSFDACDKIFALLLAVLNPTPPVKSSPNDSRA